jgi:pyruvate/2-oxoglutarate dehydrogenase complex dihydrolipoamide dehydrogenase (E3) component
MAKIEKYYDLIAGSGIACKFAAWTRNGRRRIVRELRKVHEEHTEASDAEFIYGTARFIAPRTVEIELRDGATRTIWGAIAQRLSEEVLL